MHRAMTIYLALGIHVAAARADDLPAAIVARPATLPHGVIEVSLAGGYDTAHVLGIRVRSATGLGLEVRRGMTSRLELALSTGLALDPDPGWSQEGAFHLAYRAWQRGTLELAPSVAVPLYLDRGADVTSTIAFGAGLRWHLTPCVLVVFEQRLISVPVRPAVAFDLGADAAIAFQVAPRWAIAGQAGFGEVTIVGQTDRGVAPWHHLATAVRLVYATPHAIDLTLELHGDARDPRNAAGVTLAATRRL